MLMHIFKFVGCFETVVGVEYDYTK